MPRVYLDACCLNRPFDDQTVVRIRLETEAIRAILQHIEYDGWEWIVSEVLTYELDQMPDRDRRAMIGRWMSSASTAVTLDEAIIKRAEEMHRLGLHRYDALHVACAEAGKANVFITTDDRLLRTVARQVNAFRIGVVNPLQWLGQGSEDGTAW